MTDVTSAAKTNPFVADDIAEPDPDVLAKVRPAALALLRSYAYVDLINRLELYAQDRGRKNVDWSGRREALRLCIADLERK